MTINFNEVWTTERVARLTERWAKGFSCSQIAAELGGGISRNGVISKIRRLKLPDPVGKRVPRRGLERRPQQQPLSGPPAETPLPFLSPPPATRLRNGHDPAQRRNPSHNIVAAIAIAGTEPGLPENLKGEAPDGTGVKFDELSSLNCHWPKGDPRSPDFEFCGCRALDDKPYCAFHTRKAKRVRPVSELIDA